MHGERFMKDFDCVECAGLISGTRIEVHRNSTWWSVIILHRHRRRCASREFRIFVSDSYSIRLFYENRILWARNDFSMGPTCIWTDLFDTIIDKTKKQFCVKFSWMWFLVQFFNVFRSFFDLKFYIMSCFLGFYSALHGRGNDFEHFLWMIHYWVGILIW